MALRFEERYNIFINKFNEMNNSNEFVVLGEFIDMTTKIDLQHICGEIISTTPKNIFRKENDNYIKCKCNKKIGRLGGRKKTHSKFLEELSMKNINITPIEEYNGAKKNILVQCNVCNHKWSARPDNIVNGMFRCPKCANNIKRNNETYADEIKDIYNNEYVIIGQYVNAKTPILTKHICGHEWNISPDNLKRGKGCPVCHRLSKGEYIIYNTLLNNNINFIKEYVISGYKYRFDFAVFNDKNEIEFLIEYDGIQHYIPQYGIFGGIEAFEKRQKYDMNKTQICIDKNIKLIRIPYTEFDNLEVKIYQLLKENNILHDIV